MSTKESFKSSFQIWWNGIKSLPETTSIHGFRFIADTTRHWSERFFWLIFVALSWYGSFLLIVAQYDAFQNNPISFVVETTYKDWNTHFPSVAICEHDNTKKIEEISDKALTESDIGAAKAVYLPNVIQATITLGTAITAALHFGYIHQHMIHIIYHVTFFTVSLWGPEHDFNMEEVLKELAYFKGTTYYTSEFCGLENPLPECVTDNLKQYATMVRSQCEDMLVNCSWNGVSFRCCDYFRPLKTELGTCFAINSVQGREPHAPKLSMLSNRTTGPGKIKFDVLVSANVYILNEEDVPSLTTMSSDVMSVGPEMNHRLLITIKNIENDHAARMIKPEKRKCRYTDENFLEVYRYYSYTACTVQCRKEAQLKVCNCTNFFMPNVPDHLRCNISGIICLNNENCVISVLKAKWSSRAGLYCDCLPSCTEAEITIGKDIKTTTSESHSTVEIGLAMLPSERYKRNVVRGALDLVVSTGGTWGLFLGASILSFVELLYILLFRPFCDIYSRRNDDPWYKKFGTRKLEDNKFIPNAEWSYNKVKPVKDIGEMK